MSQPEKRTLLEKLALRDRLLKFIKVEGDIIRSSAFKLEEYRKKSHHHHGEDGHQLDNHHHPKDWTY